MPFNTEVHSSRKYRLGTRKFAANGNQYIYLKGVASTIAGAWVSFDELFASALADTDTAATVLGFLAIAQAAVDSTTEFGWYLVSGSGSAGAATVADNAKVFVSAAAGVCDDTGTAGLQVVGAVWRSTDTAALATVQIHNPFVGVNVA